MKTSIKSLTLILMLSLCQMAASQGSIFTPEHEFRLGIGAYPLAESMDYFFRSKDGYLGSYGGNYGGAYGGLYGNTSNHYTSALTYTGPRIFTGSISASYTYNVLSWLSVGAAFTYAGDSQKRYDRVTDHELEKNSANRFYLMPMVRFNYLNRPLIRLYSQVGIGISYMHEKKHIDGNRYVASGCGTAAQVTLLGVSVGKKLFGFAELLGTGVQGSVVVGIGYKFNAK